MIKAALLVGFLVFLSSLGIAGAQPMPNVQPAVGPGYRGNDIASCTNGGDSCAITGLVHQTTGYLLVALIMFNAKGGTITFSTPGNVTWTNATWCSSAVVGSRSIYVFYNLSAPAWAFNTGGQWTITGSSLSPTRIEFTILQLASSASHLDVASATTCPSTGTSTTAFSTSLTLGGPNEIMIGGAISTTIDYATATGGAHMANASNQNTVNTSSDLAVLYQKFALTGSQTVAGNWNSATSWSMIAVAFSGVIPVPNAPTGVTATAVNASALAIFWVKSTGGNPPTLLNQTLYWQQGLVCSTPRVSVPLAIGTDLDSNYTILNLIAATTYSIQVQDWNAAGSSNNSTCVHGTTSAIPVGPVALTQTNIFALAAMGISLLLFLAVVWIGFFKKRRRRHR